jgi:hypothetical protein
MSSSSGQALPSVTALPEDEGTMILQNIRKLYPIKE